MAVEFVPFEACEPHLNWRSLTDALIAGHELPKAKLADSLLSQGNSTLLTRSAWINGLGIAVKAATIFPDNAETDLPSVNGGVSVFSDKNGFLEAVLDFHLVTKWKTAGDSLLAARLLARPNSQNILIVGAGTVAHSMIEAFRSLFPDAKFSVWSRTVSSAKSLAEANQGIEVTTDLETGVRNADIISCATMATEPLIRGEWLQAGQHIDLIGAYRPDMREADDQAMRRSRVFVDSRDTTINHIGELIKPIENGALTADKINADFYDISSGLFSRNSETEITLFKNGGGAHLDLMVGRYILDAWNLRTEAVNT